MLSFGSSFVELLQPGQVVYLHGHLGAGKTTFVRGFLQARNQVKKVKSPSYSILEVYKGVIHVDCYRLNQPEELENIGLRDYLDGENICFIEWPEKAGQDLLQPDFHVYISQTQGEGRDVVIETTTCEQQLQDWIRDLPSND